MKEFNTIEEALEDLRKGKIILVTDDPEKEILFVQQNLRRQKISTLWQHMEKVSFVCQCRSSM